MTFPESHYVPHMNLIRVVILLLQKRRNRGKLVFPGLPGLDNDASGGGIRINCYCLPWWWHDHYAPSRPESARPRFPDFQPLLCGFQRVFPLLYKCGPVLKHIADLRPSFTACSIGVRPVPRRTDGLSVSSVHSLYWASPVQTVCASTARSSAFLAFCARTFASRASAYCSSSTVI
ncbi:Uncharacterised protein [Salmonella enterica subsp. enterica serovar Gallinarum]|nr:Uncharacterised protein [Salmonella enterica subsp. enterica serovar Gallinarum]